METTGATKGNWIDRLGFGLGAACAIHCLMMPLLVGILPLLGLGFLAEEGTELALVSAMLLVAVVSALWGYKKHRAARVLVAFVAGGAIVLLGTWMGHDHWGRILAIGGALILVASHVISARLCRACESQVCSH